MAPPPVNTILLAVLGLNILSVLILTVVQMNHKDNILPKVDYSGLAGQHGSYYFNDPARALRLLEKFDTNEAIGDRELERFNYKAVASGYKYNNDYCKQHRAYIVNHPEYIFEQINFETNYWINHKMRTQVMPAMGKLLSPEVYPGNAKVAGKYIVDFKNQTTIFFMFNLFYELRQVGKQFSCITQESNHIPGHAKMARKDRLGQALIDYANRLSDRPGCFSYDKYFPKTWLLQKKDQCEEFFNEFNSPEYQQMKKERGVVYFRKIGADVHEGKGVFPVTEEEEAKIRQVYDNGKNCGKLNYNNLMQYNVHNLLLVTNRKFGFRQYLLIASVNPLIAFFHDGYARLSLNEYKPDATDKGTFVTNIGINLKQNDLGMTPEEIQDFTYWPLEKFHKYLMEQNLVSDPNWLNNYLRPEFKRVLIHLMRMAQNGFKKKSSVFEIFGVDYVMDENLDLWFIEANATPLINGFNKGSTVLINEMLDHMFEIQTLLLRSRVKRIISFINILSQETDGKDEIPNFAVRKKEWANITQNFFDPEFMPKPTNTWTKIIDDTLLGPNRYAGLIEERCY